MLGLLLHVVLDFDQVLAGHSSINSNVIVLAEGDLVWNKTACLGEAEEMVVHQVLNHLKKHLLVPLAQTQRQSVV